MKNPLMLLTEGNQRTAFNRDMVMVVRDQGAGRNAKVVLVNGLQYDVLHTFEYVMEALQNANGDGESTGTRPTSESNNVPPARGPLRVK